MREWRRACDVASRQLTGRRVQKQHRNEGPTFPWNLATIPSLASRKVDAAAELSCATLWRSTWKILLSLWLLVVGVKVQRFKGPGQGTGRAENCSLEVCLPKISKYLSGCELSLHRKSRLLLQGTHGVLPRRNSSMSVRA